MSRSESPGFPPRFERSRSASSRRGRRREGSSGPSRATPGETRVRPTPDRVAAATAEIEEENDPSKDEGTAPGPRGYLSRSGRASPEATGPLKLNLGSGKLRIAGYSNVDREPGPDVEVVWNLMEHPWPFPDDSVQAITAWHVLEHLPGYGFEEAMTEIHRILEPGGTVYIKVPYREPGPYNPFHFRVFDRTTFTPWTVTFEDKSLQYREWFERARQEVVVTGQQFPLWHIVHHLPSMEGRVFERDERGVFSRLPFPGRRELREWLVKRKPS